MSFFLRNVVIRYGQVIYGALRGAAWSYLQDLRASEEEMKETSDYINNLRIAVAKDLGTEEWVVSLHSDAEECNSLDFASAIRIKEDLMVYADSDPRTDFELMALNILVSISMVLLYQEARDFDFEEFKDRVLEVFFACPYVDEGDRLSVTIPAVAGIEGGFTVIFWQDRGDIVVEMPNGLIDEKLIEYQESLRLTIDGRLIQTPLGSYATEEFRQSYEKIESIIFNLFAKFMKKYV